MTEPLPVTKERATPGARAPRVLALLPAYEEAANIGRVVRAIRAAQPAIDVAVVDDGSRDATADEARRAGARVLVHPFNMGYGVALQTGYKHACRAGYDMVVQLDADGQHEPEDIAKVLEPIAAGTADVCVGSRWLGAGSYRAGFIRRAGMRFFGAIASLVTGSRVTDPTSGFQALAAPVLRFFSDDSYPVDYPDADVIITLHRAGFRVREVPVRMYPSATGKSMHTGPFRAFYYLFKMLLSILVVLMREPPRVPPAPVGRG